MKRYVITAENDDGTDELYRIGNDLYARFTGDKHYLEYFDGSSWEELECVRRGREVDTRTEATRLLFERIVRFYLDDPKFIFPLAGTGPTTEEQVAREFGIETPGLNVCIVCEEVAEP